MVEVDCRLDHVTIALVPAQAQCDSSLKHTCTSQKQFFGWIGVPNLILQCSLYEPVVVS